MTDVAFKCPLCATESHNTNDAEYRYCAYCHVFVEDVLTASPAYRQIMARSLMNFARLNPAHRAVYSRKADAWEPK
jgi:hypothetical protein